MRRPHAIRECLAAALLVMVVGCQPPPPQPVRLKPLPSGAPELEALPFVVRVVLLQHRLRPDAPVEDLWRLLGTTNVPHQKRLLWETNDLRLGDGARLAADRMNELVAQTPDRAVKVKILTVRANVDFIVPVGSERDVLDVIWTDAAGRLIGRRFEKALVQFRMVCRSDPDDAGTVRLALVPEVMWGPEQMRWVRTEATYTQQMSRASMTLADLAAEVRLPPGRLLVLGPRSAPSAAAAADLSLGGALFYERRGPDLWLHTLVLTAEPMRPGEMPDGGTAPFMPSVKTAKPVVPMIGPTVPGVPGVRVLPPPGTPRPGTPAPTGTAPAPLTPPRT